MLNETIVLFIFSHPHFLSLFFFFSREEFLTKVSRINASNEIQKKFADPSQCACVQNATVCLHYTKVRFTTICVCLTSASHASLFLTILFLLFRLMAKMISSIFYVVHIRMQFIEFSILSA